MRRTDETRALSDEICWDVLDACPSDWRRVDLRCQAVGDRVDVLLTVLMPDGSAQAVQVPDDLVHKWITLRHGMRDDDGTWFEARFVMNAPGPMVNRDFNDRYEPSWDAMPSAGLWRAELAKFPRAPRAVPAWMQARADGLQPRPDPPILGLMHAAVAQFVAEEVTPYVVFSAPSDWERIIGSYRALGDHVEFPTPLVWGVDGRMYPWEPPARVRQAIDRLHHSMYYEIDGDPERGRGTWFSAEWTAEFTYPAEIGFRYNWSAEPLWDKPPTAEDARTDLERFPRAAANVPDWLRALAGEGGAGDGPPPA
ncbi:hypothetical protein [Actinomadura parmotrematis]|uniref:Uncharacterized protein n=1 Tax=Actinomadura parmotrematis TaxID=2864039 RepID=A0ABS7FXW9_9ACTN|nr:hypothetical protein [Actinomadura parmotrematis]MBW8485285.1 hypothetical protein [Actinomadura parmotrematis]